MNRLANAIQEITELPDEQKTPMGKPPKQKFYTTVATRVEILRKHFGEDCKIITSPISRDMTAVVMKAELHVKNNGQWDHIGTGHAEEFRDSSYINKTSALENCETSAIGRALASAGLHGGEFASEFEVKNANTNKPTISEIRKPTILEDDKKKNELTQLVDDIRGMDTFLSTEEIIANVKKEFKLGKTDKLFSLPVTEFKKVKELINKYANEGTEVKS